VQKFIPMQKFLHSRNFSASGLFINTFDSTMEIASPVHQAVCVLLIPLIKL
jgi:hypothetical protein